MNCERKDQNYIERMGLPKDSKLIRSGKEKIMGVATSDGSFDYTEKGKRFMSGEIVCKLNDLAKIS